MPGKKSIPLDNRAKKRFWKLRHKVASGGELDAESREFYNECQKKCAEAGVKLKDLGAPSDQPAESRTPPLSTEGAPAETPRVTAAEVDAKTVPPVEPKQKRGKRAPLEPPIPPEQIAKLATMMLAKIEHQNREAGFGAIPDFLFPIWEAALTDYLQELAKGGYDLRKIRGLVIGVPAAAIVVQGVRRKIDERKKVKAAAETPVIESILSPKSNGVVEEQRPEPAVAGSTIREDEV